MIIAATGTNIGKTILSASILIRYNRSGRLWYWKPVQTGSDHGTDPDTIRTLCGDEQGIYPMVYSFRFPSSPDYAASREGVRIDEKELFASARRIAEGDFRQNRKTLVEMAGGILVPFHESYRTIDWIRDLEMPVLVAVSTELGTINQSLLTIETLQKAEIPVLGFYGMHPPNADSSQDAVDIWESSRESIASWSGVSCLGSFYIPGDLGSVGFRRYVEENFDLENVLEKYL